MYLKIFNSTTSSGGLFSAKGYKKTPTGCPVDVLLNTSNLEDYSANVITISKMNALSFVTIVITEALSTVNVKTSGVPSVL